MHTASSHEVLCCICYEQPEPEPEDDIQFCRSARGAALAEGLHAGARAASCKSASGAADPMTGEKESYAMYAGTLGETISACAWEVELTGREFDRLKDMIMDILLYLLVK